MTEGPPSTAFTEAVGAPAISRRLDRIEELLASIRVELGVNEREHRELVGRHNLLCDEYERLSRKLVFLAEDERGTAA